MEDFSHEGARAGYRLLMQQRPEWFRNKPRGGITILTSDADIARAYADNWKARLREASAY